MIAFIGSVFSPYYAWSGWRDPYNHCSVNVALYGQKRRWAMTERGRGALVQERRVLSIGPSRLEWDGTSLVVHVEEMSALVPTRLKGVIRLHPEVMAGQSFALDGEAKHRWRPIAPRAQVEVEFAEPALSWRGCGYFDTNIGQEPIERAFTSWDWSRVHRAKDTLIFYDVTGRRDPGNSLALRIGADDRLEPIEPPPKRQLTPTFWRIPRSVRRERSDPDPRTQTLEDGPFYCRTALEGRYGGEPAKIIHESLSLNRLRSPLVRAMLPFRMPRRFF